MQRFLIPSLITLEDCYRADSLDLFTNIWNKYQTFDSFKEKPAVSCIDGNFYLEGGNQRAIWFWLNAREYIDAEVINFKEEQLKLSRRINTGIFSRN